MHSIHKITGSNPPQFPCEMCGTRTNGTPYGRWHEIPNKEFAESCEAIGVEWHSWRPLHDQPSAPTTKPQFQREPRYLVVKIKDANAYLSPTERDTLERLCAKCGLGRIDSGKRNLECVVIESDWPEYNPTWAAIEARMNAPTTQPGESTPVRPKMTPGWVPTYNDPDNSSGALEAEPIEPCDCCAPEFNCWDGSNPCCKKPAPSATATPAPSKEAMDAAASLHPHLAFGSSWTGWPKVMADEQQIGFLAKLLEPHFAPLREQLEFADIRYAARELHTQGVVDENTVLRARLAGLEESHRIVKKERDDCLGGIKQMHALIGQPYYSWQRIYQWMERAISFETLANDQAEIVRKCWKALGGSDDAGQAPWEAISQLRDRLARLEAKTVKDKGMINPAVTPAPANGATPRTFHFSRTPQEDNNKHRSQNPMNADTKKQLESAVTACADKAAKATTAIDALQYTQAALNAANALTCLHLNVKD